MKADELKIKEHISKINFEISPQYNNFKFKI